MESGSSVSASSRCSRVAKSWRLSLAYPNARCRVFSRLGDSIGLLLFHRALQRMLVASGKINHLRHLRLRDLVSIDATDAHPAPMNMKHDLRRFLARFAEEALQHMD